MIAVSSLSYQHAPEETLRFPDFSVARGQSLLLLGNSGSGKTTLLHLVGGLLRIQQGNILIDDQNLAELAGSDLDTFRGRHIGFVFQRNHLLPALSVTQNLLMAPWLAGMSQEEGRVEEVLSQLGIWEKRHAGIRELSQGQAQRVAIARAVLNKPAIILADEPTSALDDTNCERVIRLLLDISEKNGCTLAVATHDQRLKDVIAHRIELGYNV